MLFWNGCPVSGLRMICGALKNGFGSEQLAEVAVRIAIVGTTAVLVCTAKIVDPFLRAEEEQLVLEHGAGNRAAERIAILLVVERGRTGVLDRVRARGCAARCSPAASRRGRNKTRCRCSGCCRSWSRTGSARRWRARTRACSWRSAPALPASTSAFCTPIVAPDERVRIATAPSTVIVFSLSRPPLMLKPPLVSDEKPALLKLPPTTPALARARQSGCGRRTRGARCPSLRPILRTATCGLQRRIFSRHRDLFGEGAGFQREIELHRARRVELDVGAADLLEATQLDQKFIAAGVQVGKCVVAAAVGDGRVGLLRLRARHRDGCARDDATLRIFDCARNRASIELCECRRRYAHRRRQVKAVRRR